MNKDTIRETCLCGATIEVVSVLPEPQIREFREAHKSCRRNLKSIVTRTERPLDMKGEKE